MFPSKLGVLGYDNLLDSAGFDYFCGRASDAEPLVVPFHEGVR
jgi:hypothetical protein